MRKILIMLFLILAVGIVPAVAQDADVAHLRVAHFSVDAGAVDVYVNGEVAVENLAFPGISTWMELPSGVYSVSLAPTGTSIDDAILGPIDVTLNAEEWVTTAAIGEALRDTLTAQSFVEDYSIMEDGMTRLSFFNAIPDGSPVNAFANETELVHMLGYPGFFEDGDGFYSADVVAQTYDITVEAEDGSEVASIEGILTGTGSNYFVAVVGLAANPLYVLEITDAAGMRAEGSEVEAEEPVDLGDGTLHARFAHFSPGAPEVDVYVNGVLTAEVLDFPVVTEWAEYDAGVYDIAIAPTGTSIDDAIFRGDVPLATDSYVTIATIGQLDDDTFTLQAIEEDFSSLEFGMARVSVFNAIPDSNPVDAYYNDQPLVITLGYPGYLSADSDGYAAIDILADYTTMTVTLDGTEIANTGEILLGSGESYFLAIVGLANNPIYLLEISEVE